MIGFLFLSQICKPMRLLGLLSRAASKKAKRISVIKDGCIIERDSIKLKIRAGSGGNGLSRYNGIGGTGGSVYVRALSNMNFNDFCKQCEHNDNEISAEHGEHSKQVKLVGKSGKDMTVDVPLGVELVRDNYILLARCSNPHPQKYLIACGGKGGCAENDYKGGKGEQFNVNVCLKLRPNIGLIGYPNAGKSTLMQALSPGKNIEIASYAFTTTKPQICYINFKNSLNNESKQISDDLVPVKKSSSNAKQFKTPFQISLSIADLPGIVEGAAKNSYNGFNCLKHLEYSEMIIMVVDIHGFRLMPSEPLKSPLQTIALLNREMEAYERKMVRKPIILLLNKVDVDDGEKKAQELCEFFISSMEKWADNLPKETRPRYPILFKSVHSISAKNCQLGNLNEIIGKIYSEIHPIQKKTFEEDEWLKRKDKKILI